MLETHSDDDADLVELSPCVGGLVRTWSADGAARLWSVPDDAWLREVQAAGRIGRVSRKEGRYREAARLSEADGALLVRPRAPLRGADGALTMQEQSVALAAQKRPSRSTFEDFREVLVRAVEHCAATDEYLVVERGAHDAGREPFCLFVVLPADGAPGGVVTVVETAPPPGDSELWAPFIDEWERTATISAPSSPETVATAPTVMIEAISRWDLDPWDLAFTFGRR
ncbi:hypothetical protein AXK57_15645 [Tsukamurella pulmonis]|uniref:Uncharacterized protein n=1 Tax=Tsukamurella pulmonis TaxID=47312 RepID=A0A1H1BKT0_9ACTN|nr:hypothetical protein [Tsukamurella pulmonis]KXO90295.1 hypothetical protein AXK56_09310 [Tsukamurella pulmonis]KXP08605.1 hypothetical protein AXK57_15645 [Tsukamurella pulmonis]RDH09627.1 hypothetical protein DVB88_21925 [Tsukamurella pulmonis]SDQ52615.1 hypothetical protein SAMN04489765_0748 [Tsukamurella pulmonis]SUP25028.1 Uncharacterised protein [Tsukamurella pulmonis]